jgi:hypothetical protein
MFPGRFHIVRFEDLVADRKGTASALLSGLGLEYSDSCLYPSFNGNELKEIKPWGTIRTPTPEENMRTANELNAEQKARVRAITALAHHLMGYDRFLETGTVEPVRF